MPARDDTLASPLNAEPAIFRGCSWSVLGITVGMAALIWLPEHGLHRSLFIRCSGT